MAYRNNNYHGRPYHGGNRQKDREVAQHYITYVAPNLLASFALVLSEHTDMSNDDIAYMIEQTQEMWNRSTREGWNIRKRCADLLDIDVMSELEAKKRGISE